MSFLICFFTCVFFIILFTGMFFSIFKVLIVDIGAIFITVDKQVVDLDCWVEVFLNDRSVDFLQVLTDLEFFRY